MKEETNKSYVVTLSGVWSQQYQIEAVCEGDALDKAIDDVNLEARSISLAHFEHEVEEGELDSIWPSPTPPSDKKQNQLDILWDKLYSAYHP
jgi:hypothetical protein